MTPKSSVTAADRLRYANRKVNFWIDNLTENVRASDDPADAERLRALRMARDNLIAVRELIDGTDDPYIERLKREGQL
jgi:hypothetical protein